MQGDLISRSAVLEAINEVDISDCTDVDDIIDRAYADAASVPIVDAVPVVRCRDCQWGDQNTCGDGYWCWKYGIGVSEDHFCAKGVKAKEESDESE